MLASPNPPPRADAKAGRARGGHVVGGASGGGGQLRPRRLEVRPQAEGLVRFIWKGEGWRRGYIPPTTLGVWTPSHTSLGVVLPEGHRPRPPQRLAPRGRQGGGWRGEGEAAMRGWRGGGSRISGHGVVDGELLNTSGVLGNSIVRE